MEGSGSVVLLSDSLLVELRKLYCDFSSFRGRNDRDLTSFRLRLDNVLRQMEMVESNLRTVLEELK